MSITVKPLFEGSFARRERSHTRNVRAMNELIREMRSITRSAKAHYERMQKLNQHLSPHDGISDEMLKAMEIIAAKERFGETSA